MSAVRGPEPVRIAFIVGSSRSGTTMLNRVLGLHPEVAAENELHWFGPRFFPRGEPVRWDRVRAVAEGAALRAILLRDLWGRGPDADDRAWTEAALAAVPDA